jgi:ABC-type branched-subunit amino acid transport system substrate-binding protein
MCNAITGPSSGLGLGIKVGASVYFDAVNAAGGIHGRKINLISKDDGYEPANTGPITNELLDKDKVFMLFGYMGTPTSKVAVPIATAAGVPFVAPYTGAEAFRNPVNPYVFNVRASYFDETEVIVSYLVGKGYKKIAFFGQSDSYGDAGKAGVVKALKKRKLELLVDARYTRNTNEIEPALNSIMAVEPDAVIMVGLYKPSALFIKQAKAAGVKWLFISNSVGTTELLEELATDNEGVMFTEIVPLPNDTSIEIVQQYQNDMKKAGQESQINFTSLEGYIDAAITVAALKEAGKYLDRDTFVAAMESMCGMDIGGLMINYSSRNHQALTYVSLTQVINGKLQQIR